MDNQQLSCPYIKKCGGCQTMGGRYEDTLAAKEKEVRRLLKPYVELSGIVGMDDPYCYRNKVHRVISYERDGRRERHVSGIYAEGTHRIVPVKTCLIEDREADAIIADVMELAKSFKIRAYNEDTGVGLLRHVLVRTARATGEIMVVLVLTSPVLPGKANFIRTLRQLHPSIATVVINVNDRRTSMVLGTRESVACGRGYIEDVLCGKRFRISARSFYQVNPVQTEKLYSQAIEFANLTGREVVVDAYCGIGTIGIAASDRAREVVGIELNADAVRDAASNAKQNGAKNCSFHVGDAAVFLEEMALARRRAEVVFLDPPRTGATEEFLRAATAVSPGRIVYISCNPETLARDLKWLGAHGYRGRRAVAFDMFPWTAHVETVCLLTHN